MEVLAPVCLRRRIGPVLSRAVCLASIFFLPTMMTGCLWLSFGSHGPAASQEDGAFKQVGTIKFGRSQEVDVFYPVPYASPPNLQIVDSFHDTYVIMEQKADHFRIRHETGADWGVSWEARGVRMASSPVVATPAAAAGPPVTPQSVSTP